MEIHAILTKNITENAPLFGTVRNGVTQFKRGDLPHMFFIVLNDPKQ